MHRGSSYKRGDFSRGGSHPGQTGHTEPGTPTRKGSTDADDSSSPFDTQLPAPDPARPTIEDPKYLDVQSTSKHSHESTSAYSNQSFEGLKEFLRNESPALLAKFEGTEAQYNKGACSNETCFKWTEGKCGSAKDCTRAHYFFPTLVHRAHRSSHKMISCAKQDQKVGLPCFWPGDICGFSHQTLEVRAEDKRGMLKDLVRDQLWEDGMWLKCKQCGFALIVDDSQHPTVEAMFQHCNDHAEMGTSTATRDDGGNSLLQLLTEKKMSSSSPRAYELRSPVGIPGAHEMRSWRSREGGSM